VFIFKYNSINMKKRNRFLIYPFIVAGALLILMNSCKKDGEGNPTNGRTNAVFNPGFTYGTVTDVDGNSYKTIIIGTQTWMAENLRTTHYRNGAIIPEVTDNSAWNALTSGAYCNYNNTRNNDSIAIFGRLYNFYAASDSRNVAPVGWHVPSQTEWTTLITYLGGPTIAGDKLKETFTIHWESPSAGTNESGFTALPGGFRSPSPFQLLGIGQIGAWWGTTGNTNTSFTEMLLTNSGTVIGSQSVALASGLSIRCIKD
jgi:uncharacterized protein (TIGR02145 family)